MKTISQKSPEKQKKQGPEGACVHNFITNVQRDGHHGTLSEPKTQLNCTDRSNIKLANIPQRKSICMNRRMKICQTQTNFCHQDHCSRLFLQASSSFSHVNRCLSSSQSIPSILQIICKSVEMLFWISYLIKYSNLSQMSKIGQIKSKCKCYCVLEQFI